MASGGKRGGGERVLESRHVIGLFMLMLLFSGVFFTLGYVMGRNQYDSQVRTAANPRMPSDVAAAPKSSAAAKRGKTSDFSDPPADTPTAPNSDWEFYNAGKPKTTEDHLKPVAPAPRAVTTAAKGAASPKSANASSKTSLNAPLIPGGAYTLQVAALTKEGDALALATSLQKRKFPAFVLSPQMDKYYRVQVGPYADQKAAEAAKKGLEGAGFKAIVKH
jgi:cell division septation protein DedD